MNTELSCWFVVYSAEGFGESIGLNFSYALDDIVDVNGEVIGMFFHLL